MAQPSVDEIKATYERLACKATVNNVLFGTKADGAQTVLLVSNQKDLVEKVNRKHLRSVVVQADGKVIPAGFPVDISANVLLAPCGGRLFVVRKHTPKDKTKPEFFLEVWNEGALEMSVPTADVHGQIFPADHTFGTVGWSPCGTKVIYAAEKKPKERASWWDKKKDNVEQGNKFDLQQSWGEGHSDVFNTSIFIFDTVTREISEPLKKFNELEGTSVGQGTWSPDGKGLAFVGWPTGAGSRLGLKFCINRKSRVYYASLAGETGELRAISSEDGSARSPSFNPSGSSLVWLENRVGGPHGAPTMLMKTAWGAGETTRDVVVGIAKTSADLGIYLYSFPSNPWISDDDLLFDTGFRSERKVVVVSVSKASITPVEHVYQGKDFGATLNWSVYDVDEGCVAATVSTPTMAPVAVLGSWARRDTGGVAISWHQLSAVNTVDDVQWSMLSLDAEHGPVEAIVLEPTSTSVSAAERPLLLCPHGGPHSVFSVDYFPLYAGFAALGYVVAMVNYRGSLCFGQDSIDSLLGKIGTQDVEDCNNITSKLLDLGRVSPRKMALFGGSHGGFLTAHLSAQYPDRYRAAALRNPVIDISVMVGVTDIPDWCLVESGEDYDQSAQVYNITVERLHKMKAASPIVLAEKVRAPSLVMLGGGDLRVPPSQGLMWQSALERLGVESRVLWYPEDAHPLASIECEPDVFVNVSLWVAKHIAESN